MNNICIRITMDDKILVKKICDIFLRHEDLIFMTMTFDTWLTDIYSEIYLIKDKDKNYKTWTWLLVDKRNPLIDRVIVDMKYIIDSN